MMRALRHAFCQHRWLALWLIGVALTMRIVVPVGYMPVFSSNAVTIELCSGQGPMQMAAMPGMAGHHGKAGGHAKSAMPCGFAALSAPSLAGADPILLASALVFIVVAALLRAIMLPVEHDDRLRPPLRGPPLSS